MSGVDRAVRKYCVTAAGQSLHCFTPFSLVGECAKQKRKTDRNITDKALIEQPGSCARGTALKKNEKNPKPQKTTHTHAKQKSPPFTVDFILHHADHKSVAVFERCHYDGVRGIFGGEVRGW